LLERTVNSELLLERFDSDLGNFYASDVGTINFQIHPRESSAEVDVFSFVYKANNKDTYRLFYDDFKDIYAVAKGRWEKEAEELAKAVKIAQDALVLKFQGELQAEVDKLDKKYNG